MPARKRKGINLIPEDRKGKSSWGLFFDWLLNIGRYVIVATELVVIGAFIFRFSLDRTLSELYQEIEIKKETLIQKQEFEEEFRLVQEKLFAIQELEQERESVHPLLEELAKITPKTVTLQNLVFDQDKLSLEGYGYSNTALASFAYQLNLSPYFSQINIGEINQTGGIKTAFSLTTDWEGGSDGE